MSHMPEMNSFALACHIASEAKGWTNLNRTDAQTINLMVSELSEALEEFRDKRPNTEIYYEVKVKQTDGTVSKEIVPHEKLEAMRSLDGKFGRGQMFVDAKPCGIPIELADCIIRIGQQCGTHKLDLAAAMNKKPETTMKSRTDLNEMIADATMYLSNAWISSEQSGISKEYYGEGHDPDRMVWYFARALKSILLFCESAGIDVWKAVTEKMVYNDTRPMLHGGKAI